MLFDSRACVIREGGMEEGREGGEFSLREISTAKS